jgi:hypothetical protein
MSSASTLEWLREQQKRYVAKTPEQIRAENLAMSFDQLRKRAGPPPVVSGCSYYDPSFCEGSSGGAEQLNFDSSLQDFKSGLCPPPYPLYDASHPDARDSGVIAYDAWFAQWGKLLRKKWTEKSAPTSVKKPIVTAVPSQKEHSMVSVVFTPSKPDSLGESVTPPKPVAQEVVVEIPPVVQPAPVAFDVVCVKFQQTWRKDPLMEALDRGDINWGDLDLYDESIAEWEKFHDEMAEKRLTEPEPQPEIITPPPEEIVVVKPQVIVVPAFTPGIKTLMVRNLPRDITVEKLRSIFEKYGPLKDVYIPRNMDRNSIYFGTIKGFAKVEFLKSEHSAQAFQDEYGRIVIGQNNVALEFAKEDRAPQQPKTQRK